MSSFPQAVQLFTAHRAVNRKLNPRYVLVFDRLHVNRWSLERIPIMHIARCNTIQNQNGK